jgi:hypothetical protein
VNIFHLIDDTDLGSGWQSGLYFADQQPKQSASAVANWISTTHGNCTGTESSFMPTAAAGGATTTTTTGAPGKTAALPPGCTGACAKVLTTAATACTSKSATKAGCTKALAKAKVQFTTLKRQQLKAKGGAKTKLKVTIAGFNKLLTTYTAAAKKLKH